MAANNTEIQYENCFVAFLDILGFRSKVMESQDSSEKMRVLIDSLSACGAFPSAGKKETNINGLQRLIDIRSRFFSDTIVFFLKERIEDVSQLCFMIRYLQDRLWEKRICLRGAITIGKMYWPEKTANITVGPAIIEAYHLESTIAIYPRIIVSEGLYSYIDRNHSKADPFGGGLRAEKPDALLKDYIKQDADGVYFLDLLGPDILRTSDEHLIKKDGSFSILWYFFSESNRDHILAKVSETINENRSSNDEKIRQKYEWLRNYLDTIRT